MAMPDKSLKRAALTLAVISSFVTPVLGSAVNLALPALGSKFNLNAVTLSWVQTAYLLATAVGLLPFGRLADIYGRKKIYSAGMALFGLSCLLAALAPGIAILMTARVLQGVASAMIFSTGMAILSAAFPPGERGKAMGISVAAVYIGLTLGPFLGGFLTEHLGWRSIFVSIIPVAALAWWVAVYRIKTEWADSKGEPFDLVGSVIYGLSLIAIIQGLAQMPQWQGAGMLLAGLAVLVIFVWWENRCQTPPVFQIGLFKSNRGFACSNLAAFINYCATYGVTFLLSLYLQKVRGLSPIDAGMILIAQPVMMALLSPVAGRLSDHIQPRIIASIGMGITALGLCGLAILDQSSSQTYVFICLLVNGVGFGVFSSPNMNAIMSSVQKRFYGVASGAVASMRILGQMLSMGIASSVLAIYVGRVQLSADTQPALLGALKAAFIIFSILCVIGVFASLARGQIGDQSPERKG